MVTIEGFEKGKGYLVNEWSLYNLNTLGDRVTFWELAHALIEARMKQFGNLMGHDDF